MPREIWNEGRVVGLSAYETYVKQHVIEDPTTPPATEREWLASSLAMGNSMILKVPTVSGGSDEHHYVDIPMPENTRLCAANTIIAQFFEGDAVFEDRYWANRVTDYGPLISNKSASHPEGSIPGNAIHEGVPTSSLEDWSDAKKKQLKEYMRIVDGVVLQPGTWSDWEGSSPNQDFSANLSRPYPVIRLHIKGPITAGMPILLTGFTIRTVLSGISGTDSSLQTESPQDGDFLGPAVFPWANKIIFSVPNSYIAYFAGSGDYKRSLKSPTGESSTTQTKNIKDTPVIDMQASKPETYYAPDSNYSNRVVKRFHKTSTTNPRYAYDVSTFSTLGDAPDDGQAVLTVYQKKDIYPPALYGTFVNSTGDSYLNPIDIVAPGSVKVFHLDPTLDVLSELSRYESMFPGTTAFNISNEDKIQFTSRHATAFADVLVSAVPIVYPSNASVTNIPTYNANSGQYENSFRASKIKLTGSDMPEVIKLETSGTFDAAHPHDSQYNSKSAYALLMSDAIQTNGGDLHAIQIQKCPDRGELSEIPSGIGAEPFHVDYMLDNTEYALKREKNPLRPEEYTRSFGNPAIQLYTEWVDGGEGSNISSYANLNWATLLAALKTNQAIDLLGYRLKSMRYTLTRDHTNLGPFLEFGPNTMIPDISDNGKGAGWKRYLTDDDKDHIDTSNINNTAWTQANHIVRLYVTNNPPRTQPTNLSGPQSDLNTILTHGAPVGSIGMGWNFSQDTATNTNFIGIWVCRPFKIVVSGITKYEKCWASVNAARTAVYDSRGDKINKDDRSKWLPLGPVLENN